MIVARRGAAAAACAAIAVSSCNSTFFDTFDVEEGKSRVLLADQRVLITKTAVKEDGQTVRMVCAEPSPDAVTVFGASLAAAGALATGEQVGVSGSYQQAAASIGLRTASITLIRDIGFRACEAAMNGVFDDDSYRKILGGTPAVTLGVFAIDGLTQMGVAPAVVVRAAAPKATAAPGEKPTASGESGQPPTSSFQEIKPQDTQSIKDVSLRVVEIVKIVLKDLNTPPQ